METKPIEICKQNEGYDDNVGERLTRAEMVFNIAMKHGYSEPDVNIMVSAVFNAIGNHVKTGGICRFSNFGTFQRRYRAGFKGRDKSRGYIPVPIPGRNIIYFSAAPHLKRYIAGDDNAWNW